MSRSEKTANPKIRFGKREIPLPKSRWGRVSLGSGLVVVGIIGIPFPLIGAWMIPPGMIVLSHDSHRMRRIRRRSEVWGIRRYRAFRARRQRTAQ